MDRLDLGLLSLCAPVRTSLNLLFFMIHNHHHFFSKFSTFSTFYKFLIFSYQCNCHSKISWLLKVDLNYVTEFNPTQITLYTSYYFLQRNESRNPSIKPISLFDVFSPWWKQKISKFNLIYFQCFFYSCQAFRQSPDMKERTSVSISSVKIFL